MYKSICISLLYVLKALYLRLMIAGSAAILWNALIMKCFFKHEFKYIHYPKARVGYFARFSESAIKV